MKKQKTHEIAVSTSLKFDIARMMPNEGVAAPTCHEDLVVDRGRSNHGCSHSRLLLRRRGGDLGDRRQRLGGGRCQQWGSGGGKRGIRRGWGRGEGDLHRGAHGERPKLRARDFSRVLGKLANGGMEEVVDWGTGNGEGDFERIWGFPPSRSREARWACV